MFITRNIIENFPVLIVEVVYLKKSRLYRTSMSNEKIPQMITYNHNSITSAWYEASDQHKKECPVSGFS